MKAIAESDAEMRFAQWIFVWIYKFSFITNGIMIDDCQSSGKLSKLFEHSIDSIIRFVHNNRNNNNKNNDQTEKLSN